MREKSTDNLRLNSAKSQKLDQTACLLLHSNKTSYFPTPNSYIVNTRNPKNVRKIRSNLGLVNRLSKFTPNLVLQCHLFRYFLAKRVPANITSKSKEIFKKENLEANITSSKKYWKQFNFWNVHQMRWIIKSRNWAT